MLGVEGFSQLSVSDPGAALNPLLDKQVAQDNAGWLANYGRYPVTLIAPAAAQALFSLAVAGNNLAYGTPIFCRVVWGQKKFKPGPFYTGRFSIPIAITAVVCLVFATILAMFPVDGPNPTPQNMNYTVVSLSV